MKDKAKAMIGGAPVSPAYADEIGAEGFAEDCTSAVDEASRLQYSSSSRNWMVLVRNSLAVLIIPTYWLLVKWM